MNIQSCQNFLAFIQANQQKLIDLKAFLTSISEDVFCCHCMHANASIGMHVRHILEFYHQLFQAIEQQLTQSLCYDNRVRDKNIEQSKHVAIVRIDNIITQLDTLNMTEDAITLQVTLCSIKPTMNPLSSNILRELHYVFDHTVHHMAIIKMIACSKGLILEDNFGMSAATQKAQLTR